MFIKVQEKNSYKSIFINNKNCINYFFSLFFSLLIIIQKTTIKFFIYIFSFSTFNINTVLIYFKSFD